MNRGSFGFLIGLGAGLGLGILLAPRSGEKMRSLIREKARDSAAYLKQRGSAAYDAAANAIEDSTRKVTRETEALRAAVEAGVEAGKEAYSNSAHS